MHTTLLLGAGKIGQMIATFLAATGDYHLRVGDADPLALDRLRQMADVETDRCSTPTTPTALAAALAGCQSVISALCFRSQSGSGPSGPRRGGKLFRSDRGHRHRAARSASSPRGPRPGQIFMPQCGLAPGFISILAYHLTARFERLDTVHMRVGALPQFPSNALNYNLTWSTDGLINEYCNPCQAIHEGRMIEALPLEGLESFSLDGVHYEAFNTSGRPGHALRNARRPRPRAELPHHPLSGTSRPDGLPGPGSAAWPSGGKCSRIFSNMRSRSPSRTSS